MNRAGRPRNDLTCKYDHAFTPENTATNPDGSRKCRKCARRRSQEAYLRRKQAGEVRVRRSGAYEPPFEPAPRPVQAGWHELARCAGAGLGEWVPDLTGKSMEQATREVRQHCLTCPVIADCAREALAHKPWGVWAGMPFSGSVDNDQRRRLQRLAMLDQQVAS